MKPDGLLKRALLSFMLPCLVFVPRVLVVYIGNSSEIPVRDLFTTLTSWALIVLVVFIALWPVYRDTEFAGIASSVVLFGLMNAVAFMKIFGSDKKGRHLGFTAVAMVIFLCLAALWRMSRITDINKGRLMHIGLQVLGCIALTHVVFALLPKATSKNELQFALEDGQPLPAPVRTGPNIIYIIPDTLARADVLQHHYGLEMREFYRYFRENGFLIPERSCSNYPVTAFSLASSLNMDYIVQINPAFSGGDLDSMKGRRVTVKGGGSLHGLVVRNRLAELMACSGYKVINVYGGIGFTARFDSTTHTAGMNDNDLGSAVVSQTILAHVFDKWPGLSPYLSAKRNTIRTAFSETRRIATSEQSPYFLICHVWGAHPPFMFAADGSDFNPTLISENSVEGYRAQSAYVLKELVQTSQAIIRQGDPNTIIIIQGDHGGIMANGDLPYDAPDTGLRLDNFCAIRLPKGESPPLDLFPEDLSPVQIFPILLNHYNGAQISVPTTRRYWPVLCEDKFFFKEISANSAAITPGP